MGKPHFCPSPGAPALGESCRLALPTSRWDMSSIGGSRQTLCEASGAPRPTRRRTSRGRQCGGRSLIPPETLSQSRTPPWSTCAGDSKSWLLPALGSPPSPPVATIRTVRAGFFQLWEGDLNSEDLCEPALQLSAA